MTDLPWGYQGPGTEERKLLNRIRFRLFGRWPESVVCERLSNTQARVHAITNVRRLVHEEVRYDGVRQIVTQKPASSPTEGTQNDN